MASIFATLYNCSRNFQLAVPLLSVVRWNCSSNRQVNIAGLLLKTLDKTNTKHGPENRSSSEEQKTLAYDALMKNLRTEPSEAVVGAKEINSTSPTVDYTDLSPAALTPLISSLNDDQLIHVIGYLGTLPTNSTEFLSLFSSLNKECCRRFKEDSSWDLPNSFQVLQAFHQIKLFQMFDFHQKVVVHWMKDILLDTVPASQLVTYFYFLKFCRAFPKGFDRDKLEARLLRSMEQFSIYDLGAISEAYFMCQEGIRLLPLIDRMADRLVDAVPSMAGTEEDDRTVNSMLKLFRKSTVNAGHTSSLVLDLPARLHRHIDRFSPMTMVRLVSVGSNLLNFHADSIERVLKNFISPPQCSEAGSTFWPARLKDLERLTSVLAIANHRSATLRRYWAWLTDELAKNERQEEIKSHPRSFVSLLAYCVTAGYYPDGLLRFALHPDMIEAAQKDSDYNSTKREFLLLHHSLEIECPGYDGPRLSSQQALHFQKLYQKPLPSHQSGNLSNYDQFLLALLDTTREALGGQDLATVAYLMPHFVLPDVTFRLDGQGHWLPVNRSADGLKRSVQRFALLAGARNFYRNFRSHELEPMGQLHFKVRQLKRSGYRVLLVPWHQFVPCSSADRLAYIQRLIQSATKRKFSRSL